MIISVFDMFSIGIGPSSSHTVGPMRAAYQFTQQLAEQKLLNQITSVKVELYGSLGQTGIGHGTGKAVILGLSGYLPESIDPDAVDGLLKQVEQLQQINLKQEHTVQFPREGAIVFHRRKTLKEHSNGMEIFAYKDGELLCSQVYFSIGGGFIVKAEDFAQEKQAATSFVADNPIPYPFNSGAELLALCKEHGLSIAALMMENEKILRSEAQIRTDLGSIWQTMFNCVQRGIRTEGILPGGLKVKRRAPALHRRLSAEKTSDPLQAMDWVNLFGIHMASQGPTKRHVAPNALPHNDLATTESHPPPRSGNGVDLWDSNSNSDDSLPRSSGLGSGGRDSRPEPALLRTEASPRTSVQPKRRRCSPKTSSASTSSSSLGRPSLTGPDHLFDGCSSSDDDQVVASQRRRRRRRNPIHRKTAPSLASQTKSPPPLKHRSVFDPNRRESYRSLDNTDDDDDLDENAEPRRNQFLCPPPPRGDRLEKGRGGTGDHQSLSSSICTSSQEASLASSSPTERRWRVAPHAGSAARSSGAAPVAHPGPSSSTSSRGRMQLSLRKVPRSRGELWDS